MTADPEPGTHQFIVEITGPGTPQSGIPPMTREEAENILFTTLYERHKNSHFTVNIIDTPSSREAVTP